MEGWSGRKDWMNRQRRRRCPWAGPADIRGVSETVTDPPLAAFDETPRGVPMRGPASIGRRARRETWENGGKVRTLGANHALMFAACCKEPARVVWRRGQKWPPA
jgi:hypothetical protein